MGGLRAPRALALALAFLAGAAPAFGQAAFTVARETATTADGVALGIKRFAVPGGVPVLLLHGVGSNAEEWDLPSKSFARALAGLGYDVWVANHRRTGQEPYRSAGAAGYSFDDLACRDVPALVERVVAATGERPFLIGHSMGGMMAYAWLQGTAYERVRVARRPALGRGGVRWRDVLAARVERSDARAAARNASIRGLVAIASPPRFDWPARRATVLDFWRYSYWDYNILLRDLSFSPAAVAASYAFPESPSGRVADFVSDDLPSLPYVGPALRPYLRRVAARVGRSFLTSQLLYGPNMEAGVAIEGFDLAVDDASSVVFRQFMDGIRHRTMREERVHDPLRRPYAYADHMDAITAPALVVAGRYDKLANDDTIRAEGYARLGSADRTWLAADHGHVDLVIGRDAPRDVWAPIFAWMAARR